MSRKNDCWALGGCDSVPAPRTTAERFRSGADESRGLVGSAPLNSQEVRYSRRVVTSDKPYGDDIANGVTYD